MMYTDSKNKSVRSAYIIRNWMQVKNADAIFAIGTIKQPGENASDKANETRIAAIPIVKGGTGYAVQMAINEGKPVYVFDGTKEGWYKYDYNVKNFVATETPILTRNFAGIGSRTLSTQEVVDKSLQAIRDVYKKTKLSLSKETDSNIDMDTWMQQTFTTNSIQQFEQNGTLYKFEVTPEDEILSAEYKQNNKDWQPLNEKKLEK
jgi:hypothetical protein